MTSDGYQVQVQIGMKGWAMMGGSDGGGGGGGGT